MKRIAISIFLLLIVFGSIFSISADKISAQNITLNQLVELLISAGVISPDKVTAARSFLKTNSQIVVGQNATEGKLEIMKDLKLGTNGEEVKKLQTFLKKIPGIYPGGQVTGYFGPLTEEAVKKWQRQNGINATGVVGVKTRVKLTEVTSKVSSTGTGPVVSVIQKPTIGGASGGGGGGRGGGGTASIPTPQKTPPKVVETPVENSSSEIPSNISQEIAVAPILQEESSISSEIQNIQEPVVIPAVQYALTVTQGSNGTITPGTTSVTSGGSQTFTITPASGYQIASVTVDGVNQGAISTYAFTNVTTTHTITATFSLIPAVQYALTVTQGSNGTITPGTTSVTRGGSQTFTITPASGYQIASVTVDGVNQGAISTYTFTNVTTTHTITATFSLIPTGVASSHVDKVLVVYNISSPDSVALKDYYLANRPEFSNVNVLGVTTDDVEITSQSVFTSTIRQPIVDWLQSNTSKSIYFVVLLRGIPSRVSGMASVDYQLSTAFSDLGIRTGEVYGGLNNFTFFGTPISGGTPYSPQAYPGTTVLTTHLNMGSLEATKAYVDKLKAMYLAMPNPSAIISAQAAGRGGTNYYLDEAQGYSGFPLIQGDKDKLLAKGVSSSRITFTPQTATTHISAGTDVLGYETWGVNGAFGGDYANNGQIVFSGASSWYLIKTIESFNGQWSTYQGNFFDWFSSNAFGGTNYSNTPAGATTHVEEPYTSGVANSSYLADWESGMLFVEAAWDSRKTPYFMAVGDPLIVR